MSDPPEDNMAAPIPAKKAAELHDRAVRLPFDDVVGLGQTAWNIELELRRDPKDFVLLLASALVNAKLGNRGDARARILSAYEQRFVGKHGTGELAGILLGLGLHEQARTVSDLIFREDDIAADSAKLHACSAVALLNGDLERLKELAKIELEVQAQAPVSAQTLVVLSELGIESLLAPHMRILAEETAPYSCFLFMAAQHGVETEHVVIRYWLACQFREMLSLRRRIDERLRDLYLKSSDNDLTYVNAIVHVLSVIPAIRKAA